MNFTDKLLKCSDCAQDFVFTAGEQLFFFDKQFKNDPKRCKLCKAKRAGLGRTASVNGAVALPLSRTETRTRCSSCGEDTTVPFKPTQGRPVLCRSCFQLQRIPPGVAAAAALDSPAEQVALQADVLERAMESAAAAHGGTQAAVSHALAELLAEAAGFESEAEQAMACVAVELC